MAFSLPGIFWPVLNRAEVTVKIKAWKESKDGYFKKGEGCIEQRLLGKADV
jgi:hypothetical protein